MDIFLFQRTGQLPWWCRQPGEWYGYILSQAQSNTIYSYIRTRFARLSVKHLCSVRRAVSADSEYVLWLFNVRFVSLFADPSAVG